MQEKKKKSWKKSIIIFFLFSVFCVCACMAFADLYCGIFPTTCPSGNTNVLYLYNYTANYSNSHGQLVNYTPHYPSVLCCNSTGQNVGNSSGTVFLRLTNYTNAHAQSPSNSTYPYTAYISGSSATPICETVDSACSEGYTCMLSLASGSGNNATNAHIGPCTSYVKRVCCRLNSPPPSIVFIAPTPLNGTITTNLSIIVNTSISDIGSPNNLTAFIDWNRSLVGWWRFNNEAGENSTFFKDWSTYGNNGICTNCPTYSTSGKFGGAYQFDGLNDYVDCNDINQLDGLTSITVSVWVYSTNYDQNAMLVVKQPVNAVWELYLEANKTRWRGGGTGDLVKDLPSNNQWHNIVVTQSGTLAIMYIDGVDKGNITTAVALGSSSSNVTIGGKFTTIYFFNGSIDDVMIFSRALSPEEINASFNAGSYRLYHNFTGLVSGNTYTYRAYAQDLEGNVNQTEERTLTILEEKSIKVEGNIDFGGGRVNDLFDFAQLDSAAGTSINGSWEFSPHAFNITNDGNVYVNVTALSSLNASEWLGGVSATWINGTVLAGNDGCGLEQPYGALSTTAGAICTNLSHLVSTGVASSVKVRIDKIVTGTKTLTVTFTAS